MIKIFKVTSLSILLSKKRQKLSKKNLIIFSLFLKNIPTNCREVNEDEEYDAVKVKHVKY